MLLTKDGEQGVSAGYPPDQSGSDSPDGHCQLAAETDATQSSSSMGTTLWKIQNIL